MNADGSLRSGNGSDLSIGSAFITFTVTLSRLPGSFLRAWVPARKAKKRQKRGAIVRASATWGTEPAPLAKPSAGLSKKRRSFMYIQTYFVKCPHRIWQSGCSPQMQTIGTLGCTEAGDCEETLMLKQSSRILPEVGALLSISQKFSRNLSQKI